MKLRPYHIIVPALIILVGYNLFIRKPAATIEQTPEVENIEAVQETIESTPESITTTAEFTNGALSYKTSGDLKVVETADGPILVFDENFSSSAGPDLVVYGSLNPEFDSDFDLGEFISLGSLKSNSGKQTYNLPENYQDISAIVIWCRAFGARFGQAVLP